MSGHTPGPWLLSDGGRTVYALTQYGFNRFWLSIDSCGRPTHDEAGPEECRANARLIAAAPELLEALRGLSEVIDAAIWGKPWQGYPHAQMDAAKAAIAKAEGKS